MANFTINNKLILSLFIFVHFIIISTPGFHTELKLVETSNETLHLISPTEYPMFKAGPNDEEKLVCLPCQLSSFAATMLLPTKPATPCLAAILLTATFQASLPEIVVMYSCIAAVTLVRSLTFPSSPSMQVTIPPHI
ncbi:hypothetical protein SO802_027265 [Lithocarpus litseifolius]|uniref:Transmembrane protein n=1 Tax=Lithocarpus litseifolius TaxID=425828 RepID=A0AAW2C7Q6_9ROSI